MRVAARLRGGARQVGVAARLRGGARQVGVVARVRGVHGRWEYLLG